MATGQSSMRNVLTSSLALTGSVVLLYHRIGMPDDKSVVSKAVKYCVSNEQFAAQLGLIRKQQLSVLSLGEVLNKSKRPQAPEHRRHASITFDDGQVSDYTNAFPILTQFHFSATFFLNSAHIGHAGYLNWSQVAEMQRAGMSFQSHAHEHVYLTRLPLDVLDIQMRISKQTLEDRLGESVDYLAAPYGDVNSRVIRAALSAGYKAVCTSWNWPTRAGVTTINRVAVYAGTTPSEFSKLLQGNLSSYTKRAVRAALLHFPKRVRLHVRPLDSNARISEEHA